MQEWCSFLSVSKGDTAPFINTIYRKINGHSFTFFILIFQYIAPFIGQFIEFENSVLQVHS